MAAINTKVVRRSHALSGLPYGADFGYDESQLCSSRAKAILSAAGLGTVMAGTYFSPTRTLLKKLLPAPGEGPNQATRDKGFFEFWAQGTDEYPLASCQGCRATRPGLRRDVSDVGAGRALSDSGRPERRRRHLDPGQRVRGCVAGKATQRRYSLLGSGDSLNETPAGEPASGKKSSAILLDLNRRRRDKVQEMIMHG